MHWGGRGKLRSLFLRSPFQERPWGTKRESDPPEGWIRRSTALGVCAVQASSLAGTGFLWILAEEWAREMALASAFVDRKSVV